MNCSGKNHIFVFWGQTHDGKIPDDWKCECGEKTYKENMNKDCKFCPHCGERL